jgi:glycosyltransferase involved in cell wall biosynthesis
VKVLDAMASGRPVVTSQGLDISKTVEAVGCGFVIPYDKRAFKETLEKAIAAPKLLDEMGRKGKAYFDKELSWERSQDELLKAYKALAGQS